MVFSLDEGLEGVELFSIGDDDEICSEYEGCTNQSANNYNPSALVSDNSCEFDCEVYLDENNNPYQTVNIVSGGGVDQSQVSWVISDTAPFIH